MVKTLIVRFMIVLVSSLLLSSCFLGFFFGGSDISMSVGTGPAAPRAYQLSPMSAEEYYKDERKSANRGELVASVTPHEFVLDIDGVWVYGPLWKEYPILEVTTTASGDIIPNHVNLVHAKDFIRDVSPNANRWNGMMIMFQPDGTGFSNDGLYVRSVTSVDLGPAYDGINLPGEITDQLSGVTPGLHYFGFNYLQPVDTGDGFLAYLIFGDDIREPSIQNPTGQIADWELPVGLGTNGNSVQLFFPGPTIVLGGLARPEISLNWDLNNLVEIYDAGTPGDRSDDIVTFAVADPFPLSLEISEWQPVRVANIESDVTPPAEVLFPAIAGPNTVNTLQWINPPDEDFSHILIVRKSGVAPLDRSDGTVVYTGYRPNYWDSSGSSGTHYYYRVMTVDYAGNVSSGVVLDQVQR